MFRHDLRVLGHVARTHGVNGAVLIRTTSEIEPSTDEPVFVDMQGPVPFFVQTVKPGSGGFIVQFEWIDSIEKAEKLIGNEVLIEEDEAEVEDVQFPVIGFALIDSVSGKKGKILDVRPLDHHPLLIVDFQGKEVMIPLVEEYIDEVDDSTSMVKMNLPDGLLDL